MIDHYETMKARELLAPRRAPVIIWNKTMTGCMVASGAFTSLRPAEDAARLRNERALKAWFVVGLSLALWAAILGLAFTVL